MWTFLWRRTRGIAPLNCFWTVVLEKTLQSPLDCKEIQPVHPKGDQSWVFIEGLMLKLKFQYFGYLMWKTDTLEKILMLGKTEGRRRRGWQEDKMVGCITNSMDMFEYTLGFVMDREAWCTEVHGAAKSRTSKLLNWLWNGLIRSKVMHILNFDKCCKFTKIL